MVACLLRPAAAVAEKGTHICSTRGLVDHVAVVLIIFASGAASAPSSIFDVHLAGRSAASTQCLNRAPCAHRWGAARQSPSGNSGPRDVPGLMRVLRILEADRRDAVLRASCRPPRLQHGAHLRFLLFRPFSRLCLKSLAPSRPPLRNWDGLPRHLLLPLAGVL